MTADTATGAALDILVVLAAVLVIECVYGGCDEKFELL